VSRQRDRVSWRKTGLAAVLPAALLAAGARPADCAEPVACADVAKVLPNFVGAARSDRGLFRVDVFAEATPLAVNRLLSLLVFVKANRDTSQSLELVQVSADMLAHRHGMYTQPVVRPCTLSSPSGLAGFVVDGIQLHMRGVWTFEFDAHAGESRDVARIDVGL
jgi:hypothetical protein